jgi:hypothetical protein
MSRPVSLNLRVNLDLSNIVKRRNPTGVPVGFLGEAAWSRGNQQGPAAERE